MLKLAAPILLWFRDFVSRLLQVAHPEYHPRTFSNAMLRKIGSLVKGSVINVSGWKDADKEGGTYRSYFPRADSYHISNFKGARGTDDSVSTDVFLDLQAPLPMELKEKYDVVFNHTTFEHLADLETAFNTLCGLSRDLVILVLPYSQPVHFIKGSFGDYCRLTPGGLATHLQKRGFNPLMIETNQGDFFPTYVFAVASKHVDQHQDIAHLSLNIWQDLVDECFRSANL